MPEDVEERPKTYRSEGDGEGVVRQRCDIVTEEKGDLSRMAEDEIPKAASENELKAAASDHASARSKVASSTSASSSSSSSICTSSTTATVNGTTANLTPNDNFTAFKKFSMQQNGGVKLSPSSNAMPTAANLSSPLPHTLNSALYLPYSYAAAAAAAAAASMPPLILQGGRLPFVATPYASPSNIFGAQSPLFTGEGAMATSMSYPFLNLIDFSKTGSRGNMVIPAQASPSYGSPYLSAMELGLLAARNSPMFGSMPSSPSYGLSPLNSPTTNTAIPVIGKPQFFPLLPTGQSQTSTMPSFLRFPNAVGNPLASMAQVSLPNVTSTVTSVAANFMGRRRHSSASNSDEEKSSDAFGQLGGGGKRLDAAKQRELRMSHIKKPLNAFMLYMKEMRPHVMAEVGLKERQSAEINRILGRRWHMLNKDEQQKYYDMARKERELHMERYPGWSARDNYAIHKKKKRKRDKTSDVSENAELKKCRARFGLDQQSLWCKHCKRKKKCLWFKDSDGDGGETGAEHSPPSQVSSTTPHLSAHDEEALLKRLPNGDSGNSPPSMPPPCSSQITSSANHKSPSICALRKNGDAHSRRVTSDEDDDEDDDEEEEEEEATFSPGGRATSSCYDGESHDDELDGCSAAGIPVVVAEEEHMVGVMIEQEEMEEMDSGVLTIDTTSTTASTTTRPRQVESSAV